MTEIKCVTVTLTYEAVALLKQLLPTPWSDNPAQIYRVGQFLEGDFNGANPGEPKLKLHFPAPNERSLSPAEEEAVQAHNERFKEWAALTATVSVPQKVFSDVQACIKHYVSKKAIAPKPAVVALLKEFELTQE